MRAPSPFQNVSPSDTAVLAKDAPANTAMTAFGYGQYDNTLDDGQGRSGSLTPTFSSGGEYVFSAGATQPWLCSGDSGGPLKGNANGMVYGFASWTDASGSHCGNSGHWATTRNSYVWLKGVITALGNNCSETSTQVSCW